MENDTLFIDLSDLEVEDITVLSEEGSRGMPEFAASCSISCGRDGCSCSQG